MQVSDKSAQIADRVCDKQPVIFAVKKEDHTVYSDLWITSFV